MTRVIMQASRFAARGLCDHDAKYTMFAQLMHQAHYRGANALRCSGQAWSAQFRGEGSIDAGGPYRESITNVSAELQSTALPLLVQCPNFNNDACVLAWCTRTPPPPPPPPVQHYPHTRISHVEPALTAARQPTTATPHVFLLRRAPMQGSQP